MTILNCPEYSCLQMFSVDDTKVVDLTCTWSILIFQPKTNERCTKMKKQNITYHDRKSSKQRYKNHTYLT
jgi:hypothetical protein